MLTSTLYPKIGKLSDFVHRSRSLDRDLKLPLVGTVKLQGTHADIVIGNDDNVRIQSRNRADLTVEDDNLGFAAFAMPLREIILALKDRYIARYRALNPGKPIRSEEPFLIAGEWFCRHQEASRE